MVKIPVKTDKDDKHEADDVLNDQDVQETAEEGLEETPAPETEDTIQDVEEGSPPKTDIDESSEEEASEEELETPEAVDELTQLKTQLETKECEVQEHLDARLRLQAEFDNFKKRKEKETVEFRKYANEDFIRELLVLVDDFDRAIAAAEQSHKLEDFLKGVELIFDKFLGVLQKKGVKEIEAKGQPFNPEIHEAVTQIETDELEEGTIVEVFQKGYYLHDRVLLAPKVAVAKNKES